MSTTSFTTIALLVFLLSTTTDAALIASSKLEQCVNDGTTEALPCEKKFTVALSIDGGQNNTEAVEFWRGGLAEDGTPLVLSNSVKITVAKSRPMVRYPVYYSRTFNAKPAEKVIYTGVLKCNDAPSDDSPTCGRAYGDGGDAIPFSEGFCCNCGMCQVLGFCSDDSRANTDCSIFGDGAAASCLAFDPLWYAGYRVGPAETWYAMTVTIEQEGQPTATLHLGPDQLGSKSTAFEVTARLIGDFAAFRTPKNLESRFLFIPSAPANHPIVQAATPDEWMFLESHLVDSGGTMCDRVGVSYAAFAAQGNRCELNVGSCLKNQLSDFRNEDASRRSRGLTPEFFVGGHGTFVIIDEAGGDVATEKHFTSEAEHLSTTRRAAHPLAADRPYLAYEVEGVQASLITLTFVADNISFIVNAAKGEIVSVNISDFEANSKEGKLKVVILNTGRVPADFHVTVRNCTEGTFPITANVATLQPLHPKEFIFDVRSENLQGQLNSCNVSLYNSLFDLLDSTNAKWESTDTIDDRGSQGGGGNGASGVPVNAPQLPGDGSSGCTDCPWYNPVCFLTRRCFLEIVIQIVVVCCIIALVVCLIKNRAVLTACCSSADNESDDGEKRDKRRQRRKRRSHRQRSDSESADDAGHVSSWPPCFLPPNGPLPPPAVVWPQHHQPPPTAPQFYPQYPPPHAYEEVRHPFG